jgi:hypothetical protein
VTGNLNGYVVRRERPEVDAVVTVVDGPGMHIDLAPMSDADGWFALDDLAAGHWRLRANASDGAIGEAGVDVWDNSLSEVTIELREETEPVPDIFREPRGKKRADPNGSQSSKSSERGSPSSARIRKHANGVTPSVVGWVTDAETGRPVEGALVVITDGPGPLPDAVVVTDLDGRFEITALEEGEWALLVRSDERASGHLVVSVVSGRPVNITIAVPPSPG